MSYLHRYWNNTKELPFVIRQLCQGGMVAAPLLALLIAVPIGDWRVNQREVSYQDLWSSGAGLAFLAFTLLGAIGSWGMAARSPSTRWALVVAPSAPFPIAALRPSSWFTQQAFASVATLVFALATSVAIYVCLFHMRSVRTYFNSSNGITQA